MLEYHKKLKLLREMRNFTQEHMAGVLNISQRSYSSLENGQTQLTVDRLFDIANALQVDIGEIIGVENHNVYHNNFNNNSAENKGNLIFNQDKDVFKEQRKLYERLLEAKDLEIAFLRNLVGPTIPILNSNTVAHPEVQSAAIRKKSKREQGNQLT